MACKFFEMLERRWNDGARVCVGLDPVMDKLPDILRIGDDYSDVFTFNEQIIDVTQDIALAYKLNIAFYSGIWHEPAQKALGDTIEYIRDVAPEVPIILDSKRGDIGNTNQGYVEEAFEAFDADAVTVNPYFGMQTMEPFLERKDKGIIVVCKTSNPGSDEFQNLTLVATNLPNRSMPLYEYVADRVASHWNYNGNCALVVAATYPEELKRVRERIGDMWILVPGIGTQGSDLEASVRNGINSKKRGIIINSSSGIIFSKDPRAETQKLTESIDAVLASR